MQRPACGASKETPQHFLLECPAYTYNRCKLGPKKGEIERKFAEMVSSEKKIVMLAHYLQATGRFTKDKKVPKSNGGNSQMNSQEA